jgi:6-hydroxytryprostatin B O-methyltransferase
LTYLFRQVGGGLGQVSLAIAETSKDLKFIVEDLIELTDQANDHIASSNLSSRVSFVGHDFFQPQPDAVKDATVFLLSNVLHDWPTEKCQVIMKNIADVMQPGSRIILVEQVLPNPGQLLEFQEATIRGQDLGMFGFLTARERTVDDFETMMRLVDPRLKLFSVIGPPKMKRNSLIEFRLQVEA